MPDAHHQITPILILRRVVQRCEPLSSTPLPATISAEQRPENSVQPPVSEGKIVN